MTRPWYRSPVLWFGLPGFVFLCAAWVDSMSNVSSGRVALPAYVLSVTHQDAHLEFSWHAERRPATPAGRWSMERKAGSAGQEKQWFPLPSYHRNDLHRSILWHNLKLPHWFVILCYLGLWQLPWLWRYHREERIRRTLAEVG